MSWNLLKALVNIGKVSTQLPSETGGRLYYQNRINQQISKDLVSQAFEGERGEQYIPEDLMDFLYPTPEEIAALEEFKATAAPKKRFTSNRRLHAEQSLQNASKNITSKGSDKVLDKRTAKTQTPMQVLEGIITSAIHGELGKADGTPETAKRAVYGMVAGLAEKAIISYVPPRKDSNELLCENQSLRKELDEMKAMIAALAVAKVRKPKATKITK